MTPHSLPRNALLASLSALALMTAFAPLDAAAQTTSPSAKVNHLTSFHQYSESVSTSTSPEGWPGAQRPTSPPLYVTHPTLQRGYLFGGFAGQNSNIARGVLNLRSGAGLYWLPTTPGVYERLGLSGLTVATDDELYGRINGTPLQGADGGLYGVMASVRSEATDNNGTDGRITASARLVYTSTVGRGVIFRTDSDGTHMSAVTTPGELYSPNGALVKDSAGNFYGVDKGPLGQGRIYKVTLSGTRGTVSTVHEFTAGPSNMRQIANGLILGSDGWLYGVTGYDRGVPFKPGTPSAPETPVGTLYRVNPASPSSFAVLHTFTLAEGEINVLDNVTHAHASGSRGLSWVQEGRDGWLYGTTSATCQGVYDANATWTTAGTYTAASPQCGTHMRARTYGGKAYPYYDGPKPYGAVYRIPMNGSGSFQLLHTFSETDGSTPRGPLAVGPDGSIYGTTLTGGANRHWPLTSSTYKDSPTLCTDMAFASWVTACNAAGAENYDTLLNYGQSVTDGVLYRIVPSRIAADGNGGFELLHSFKFDVDGMHPLGVAIGADGRLYGVSANGGTAYKNANGVAVSQDDQGAVFQVDLAGDTPSAGVTLNVAPAEIKVGETATLTWTSFQTANCRSESSAQDWTGPVATEGSVQLTKAGGTYRYSVICTDTVKGGEVSSTLVTLYVGAAATAQDGNQVQYGNGGGGPFAPALLLPLAALAGFARFAGFARRGALRRRTTR
ncbi:MAG: choice-of-anchor tandem repeat GloVer-containing protein [Pseudomonadota bacterium]